MQDQTPTYSHNDVCIVSYGCVLPEAENPEKFWNVVLEGKPIARKIDSDRWNQDLMWDQFTPEQERTIANIAGQVSAPIFSSIKEKHKLPANTNRLKAYTFEAISQTLEKVTLPKDRKRIGAVIGLMNPDKSFYAQVISQEQKKLTTILSEEMPEQLSAEAKGFQELTKKHLINTGYIDHNESNIDNVIQTSLLRDVCDTYDIQGPAFYTDAACASSLAAVDVSINLLQNYEVDAIITGGLESNLDLGAFVLFSKVKAQSKDVCLPFDRSSKGITQSEGAVIFCLKRLEDAVRDKDPIHGIIKKCSGSSDGRAASLFQPTLNGQLLAYKKVHGNSPTDLHYIEAHATGTSVGDAVEAESLQNFFGKNKINVGSAKSVFGHTKGAAGATSLLKALLVADKKVAPPALNPTTTYFSDHANGKLSLNKTAEKIHSSSNITRVSVSSLGFGGSNFHLLLEKPEGKIQISERQSWNHPAIVSLGEVSIDKDTVFQSQIYKLPPNSLKQIDPMQLKMVQAVETLVNNLPTKFLGISKELISVISAGSNGLEQLSEMVKRIFYYNLLFDRTGISEDSITEGMKNILSYVDKEIYPQFAPISEDSGPGILNNVLAGRVCNAFDWMGKNFSVDCDTQSFGAAKFAAFNELKLRPNQVIIVCGLDEEIDEKNLKINRLAVRTEALTTERFAQQNLLPIQSHVMTAQYERSPDA